MNEWTFSLSLKLRLSYETNGCNLFSALSSLRMIVLEDDIVNFMKHYPEISQVICMQTIKP